MDIEFTDAVFSAFIAVATLLGLYIVKRFDKDLKYRDATRAFLMAVAEVKVIYVEALKERNFDGKLTDEEKAEARDLALKKALEIAGPKVADFIKTWGEARIRGMIELAVKKLESK